MTESNDYKIAVAVLTRSNYSWPDKLVGLVSVKAVS